MFCSIKIRQFAGKIRVLSYNFLFLNILTCQILFFMWKNRGCVVYVIFSCWFSGNFYSFLIFKGMRDSFQVIRVKCHWRFCSEKYRNISMIRIGDLLSSLSSVKRSVLKHMIENILLKTLYPKGFVHETMSLLCLPISKQQ